MSDIDSTFSATLIRELFNYAPDTGELTNKITRGKAAMAGAIAGCDNGYGYLSVKLFGVSIRAHRIAWMHVHGEWPSGSLDHINGDPSDNRIANLRLCTQSENNQNFKKLREKKTSRYMGVYWAKPSGKKRGRWRAIIAVNGKKMNLGSFRFEEEAAAAYAKAKAVLHPFSPLPPAHLTTE